MKKILEQTLVCDLTLELATYAVDNGKKLLSIHTVSDHVKNAKLSESALWDYLESMNDFVFDAEAAYNEIAHGVVA